MFDFALNSWLAAGGYIKVMLKNALVSADKNFVVTADGNYVIPTKG